jgi:hypothetical protein
MPHRASPTAVHHLATRYFIEACPPASEIYDNVPLWQLYFNFKVSEHISFMKTFKHLCLSLEWGCLARFRAVYRTKSVKNRIDARKVLARLGGTEATTTRRLVRALRYKIEVPSRLSVIAE